MQRVSQRRYARLVISTPRFASLSTHSMNAPIARPGQTFTALLSATREIAGGTAAQQAAAVDKEARFPTETMTALRAAGVLSAPVPQALGGAGCNMRQLTQLCSTLAQGCGSSGMVLAMHFIQVACIARHGLGSDFFCGYLQELVTHQHLLASMTSEVGTSGDTRSSVCAVERNNGRFVLTKDGTTGSYCAHADAVLVTCRRDADAPASDQVLVLVKRENATLTQTTTWDTLGMRGTCSPGFLLESSGPAEQILPGSFADNSAQTMVPYSHILWASLWWGIAADAVGQTILVEVAASAAGPAIAARGVWRHAHRPGAGERARYRCGKTQTSGQAR